jgi:CHAT domain-containing protein
MLPASTFPVVRRLGATLVVVVLAAASGSAVRQDEQRLVAGAVHDRTMKAGEVHRYDVELAAGDYFAVAVDQHGVDVLPVILDPAGAVVYEYDYGEWGDDPAAIVAASGGRHRLEVRTMPISPPSGRYRLRVEALRAASALDQRRARALQRQTAALRLVRSQPRDLPRARQEYGAILAEWEALEDGLGIAHALTALGFITNGLDDRAAALDYALREVEAYRAIGHDYGEARALRNVGIDGRSVGDFARATAAFDRSLALHRAANRRSSVALLLADLSSNSGALGDFGRALDYAYEAIATARADGNPRLEATGWNAAALAHQALGELEIALDAYRRVRVLAPDDDLRQADTATRMGTTYLALGDVVQAEPLLQEGLAGWRKRGFRAQQAQALVGLGDIEARAGRLDRAREHFAAAVTLSVESKYPLGEIIGRRRLAETLLERGMVDGADAALTTSDLDLVANPGTRARLLAVRARVALARGDLDAADRFAGDAVALTESALGRAQSSRIDAGVLASAQPVYEAAVQVAMAAHDAAPGDGHDARAFVLSEKARARSLLELLADASAPTAPPAAGPGDLNHEFRQLRRTLNAKGTALAGAPPRARASLERDVDELATRLAILEARLRRERPEAAAVAAPQTLDVDALRQGLGDRTVLVEYMLGTPHSYAWVLSRRGLTSVRLAPRAAIEAAAQKALTLADPPRDGAAAPPAPADAGQALADLILAPLPELPADARLLVVAPGLLQDVPFAALPVGAGGRRVPLVVRHEIVHAPSAAAAQAMASMTTTRAPARRTLAVFADPVFDADDPRVLGTPPATAAPTPPTPPTPPAPPALSRALRGSATASGVLARLPFTRLEAERIAAVAGGAVTSSIGFAANLGAVRGQALAGYRILHFATHGILNTRTPELSGLVLSLVDEGGRTRDGFLRLHDVEDLRLAADLVVLSACDTARGRRIEGEGTIGLTRAFLTAGARHVVASLWRVDDAATAELMHVFYTQLLRHRRSPAAALRVAQRQLATSGPWTHPYYWAGFVVQGS